MPRRQRPAVVLGLHGYASVRTCSDLWEGLEGTLTVLFGRVGRDILRAVDSERSMRCPVCHTAYPPGYQFCSNDGAALVADAPPSQASGGAYDRVGASLAALDETLGASGPVARPHRQDTVRIPTGQLPPRAAAPLPPAPSMHPAALVALGALGFVLVAAIGFFAYQAIGGGGSRDSGTLVVGTEPLGGNGGQQDAGEAVGVDLGSTYLGDGERDTSVPAPPPSSTSGSAVRSESIPGGSVEVYRTSTNELRLVARGSFGTSHAPKPLSTRTRLSGFTHRTLAGRDVVEFEASDGRWRTTYYWEYAPNVMHFVARDQQNGDVNVSRQAYTPDVLRAALGRVPQRTWQSREEREATQSATSDKRFNVVLGAYPPSDAAGHAERLRRVRASGNTIRTASSESLGMRSGYRVIYIGPLSRDAAYRMLDEMRQYTGDAYLSNVR